MPRTLTGSIAASRVIISLAALLVKVTARMPPGDTWPVCISQAMRVVSTRVLPEPAPARISALPAGSVTAAQLLRVEVVEQRRICGGREVGEHPSIVESPAYRGYTKLPKPPTRASV